MYNYLLLLYAIKAANIYNVPCIGLNSFHHIISPNVSNPFYLEFDIYKYIKDKPIINNNKLKYYNYFLLTESNIYIINNLKNTQNVKNKS